MDKDRSPGILVTGRKIIGSGLLSAAQKKKIIKTMMPPYTEFCEVYELYYAGKSRFKWGLLETNKQTNKQTNNQKKKNVGGNNSKSLKIHNNI